MDKQPATLIATLHAAIADLLWLSEIDAPFEVLHWSPQPDTALTAAQVRQLTHQPPQVPVQVLAVDDFFAGATEEQDWFEAEERAIAARYRELVALLKQHLSHMMVYQVGSVSLDLSILGKAATGDIVGLATKAVET